MKSCLVFTTIHVPHIAVDYCRNFKKYSHHKDVETIIIGDLKTPNDACKAITKKLQREGHRIEYFDVEAQESWMRKYPQLKKIIPYNNDGRRNVGFLMALKKKAEVLVSIDDDSYPMASDYLAEHSDIGKEKNLQVVSTSTGWFDPCSILTKNPEALIYARGFPYTQRFKKVIVKRKIKRVQVGVNAGLWLSEPDVDAVTRLAHPTKITGLKGPQIALDKNCYAPINTQNTALIADLVPAFYFVPMKGNVNHLPIARFADIWTGWFLKKSADHLNFYVSYGKPLTDHRRNNHDLFNDLYIEMAAVMYNDHLVELIREVEPIGENCVEVYADLSKKFHRLAKKSHTFPAEFKKYIDTLYEHQQIWLSTVDNITR